MPNDCNYSIACDSMMNYFKEGSRKMVCKNKVEKSGHQKWY